MMHVSSVVFLLMTTWTVVLLANDGRDPNTDVITVIKRLTERVVSLENKVDSLTSRVVEGQQNLGNDIRVLKTKISYYLSLIHI